MCSRRNNGLAPACSLSRFAMLRSRNDSGDLRLDPGVLNSIDVAGAVVLLLLNLSYALVVVQLLVKRYRVDAVAAIEAAEEEIEEFFHHHHTHHSVPDESGAAVGAERASDWRMGGYGQSWDSVECAAVEVSVAGEVFAAGDKT